MRRTLTSIAIVAAILATAGCAARKDASKETLTTATELGDFGPRNPARDGSGRFGGGPSNDPIFGGGSAESGVFGGGNGAGNGSLVGGGGGGYDRDGNFVGPSGEFDSAGNFVGPNGGGGIRANDGSLASNGTGSAGGFDASGNYVGPTGQFDAAGNFVGNGGAGSGAGSTGGGFDSAGNFVGPTGQYDAAGNFVGGGSNVAGAGAGGSGVIGSIFGLGSGSGASDPTASGLDPNGVYRDYAGATAGAQSGNTQISGAYDGQAGLSSNATLGYDDRLFDTSSASLGSANDFGTSSSGSLFSGAGGGGAASLAGINFPGDDGGARYFAQQVGDTVRFDTDSSTLSATAREILRRQAAWLVRHPNISITVEGHADERGPRDYNLALGARRANAARSYLTSLGIGVDRIRTVSYGKERPVSVGSTPAAWAQNRRSVTVLRGV